MAAGVWPWAAGARTHNAAATCNALSEMRKVITCQPFFVSFFEARRPLIAARSMPRDVCRRLPPRCSVRPACALMQVKSPLSNHIKGARGPSLRPACVRLRHRPARYRQPNAYLRTSAPPQFADRSVAGANLLYSAVANAALRKSCNSPAHLRKVSWSTRPRAVLPTDGRGATDRPSQRNWG